MVAGGGSTPVESVKKSPAVEKDAVTENEPDAEPVTVVVATPFEPVVAVTGEGAPAPPNVNVMDLPPTPTAPTENAVDAPGQVTAVPMAVARSLLPYAETGP